MIKIITRILVKGTSASEIYNWINHLTPEQYRQWHQNDHIGGCQRPTNLNVGDTIWFEEIMEDFKVSYKWKIIDLNKNQSISMKAKSFYPIYLQLSLLPINEDTEVIHELKIGFNLKGIEKLFDWIVSRFILTSKRIASIRQHAIEEFKNLENIL